jgi:hypothetical protein
VADRDAGAEAGVVADLKRALEAAIGDKDRAVREKRQAVEEKNQLVEEKNQLVEEKNQLVEEKNQLVEEKNQVVEEKERALQVISDKDSLQNGTYYTPIDQVWKKEVDTYDDVNLFEALRRDRAPHFVARFAKGAAPPPNPPEPKEAWYVYSWTRAKAESAEYEMVSQRTTRSGLDPEKRLSIWPKDIFGSADTSKAEVAHLVPASHSASTLFFDVAICALGLDDAGCDWQTIQKAIHGSREPGRCRTENTGIKHFVSNKISLGDQKSFFDERPCVLIVPALALEVVKDWGGGGYKAIVMIDEWRDEKTDTLTTRSKVCRGIDMLDKAEPASPADVELARKLLEQVVLGMAYSLNIGSTKREASLSEGQLKTLKDLRNAYIPVDGTRGVCVPRAQPELAPRVRVVEFHDVTNEDEHPAPDPFLLAVRAAVTWSERNHKPLLAAAGPRGESEGGDEGDEDLHNQAMDEFLDWRKDRWRPHSREDLAAGLHQNFGYQGGGDEGRSASRGSG